MTTPARRAILAAVLLAWAGTACAAEHVRTVPIKKLFPFLDVYQRLAPAQRSRFQLAYRLSVSGAPLSSLRLTMVGPDGRTAVPVGSDRRISRLPSPAMLAGGYSVEIATPQGAKLGLELEVAPTARPANELDAQDLAVAVRQAGEAVHKAAGVMGFAAPKMQRVVFEGAQGGQLVDTSGRTTALPVVGGSPVFDPAAAPAAHLIRFTRAPLAMSIGPAK